MSSPGHDVRPDVTAGQWVALDDDELAGVRGDGEPLVSIALAVELRDAGLAWEPCDGDRFVIPGHGLDAHTFRISPMSVEVRRAPGGRLVTFNGAVEWALDAVHLGDVVWLPTEAQLREALGHRFRALSRVPDGYRCTYDLDGQQRTAEDPRAVEAYGLALLHCLRRANRPDRA